ncbi:hypothetical protein [Roseivivax sediminis]|uniref:Uncharacterized protein n=1 Tax=Roseivivax sediminis TaxID=936889 RepID=A0A1I1YTD7_9RHOB|nr:hypothetical protein [Roseivivax sediminis]SFE22731.1 hypothetical protein SAMN04515678_107200 [Roseivivax sediminis]
MEIVVDRKRRIAPVRLAQGCREKRNAAEQTLAALDEANEALNDLKGCSDHVDPKAVQKLESVLSTVRKAQAWRLRVAIIDAQFLGLLAANDP